MVFPFNTNRDGLLLGAAGPVWLRLTDSGPRVRFVPTIFLLADAEDEEAHRLCARLLFQVRRNG
eukprot:7026905-Lingulodinium_polyedra.AAC.1